MSIRTYEVGGTLLVFGLDWRVLPGAASEASELKKLAEELSSHYVAKVRTERFVSAGFVGGSGKEGAAALGRKLSKAKSAAALFATAQEAANQEALGDKPPPALLVLDLGPTADAPGDEQDHDRYALIGIRDGVPFPGFDVVGTQDYIRTKAYEFIQLSSDDGIATFGNTDILDANTKPISPDALVQYGKVKQAGFSRAGTDLRGILFLVTILLLLVGGGIGYYKWQQYKQQQLLAAQAAAKRVDPATAYKTSLAEAASKAGVPLGVFASAVYGALSPLEVTNFAGWSVGTATCADGRCDMKWGKAGAGGADSGTYAAFEAGAAALYKARTYELNGSGISTVVEYKAEGAVPMENLPSQRAYTIDLVSRLQSVQKIHGTGLTFNFEAPTAYALPSGITAEQVGDLLIKTGAWRATGNLWMMSEFLGSLPKNMSASKLGFTLSGKDEKVSAQFQVEGRYYVKK